MRGRRWGGRKFAVGPDGAVFEVLLFPDGDGALQGVNGETASVKGGSAMSRADSDKDAGFADFEAPQPVDYGYQVDTVFFVELGADFAHFGEGHGFVGFVVEVESRAVVGLITHESVKGNGGAIFWRADVAYKGGHVDGFAHQLIDVIVGECRHVDALATAHGRQKRNFVAAVERRIPGGEFLIARSDN